MCSLLQAVIVFEYVALFFYEDVNEIKIEENDNHHPDKHFMLCPHFIQFHIGLDYPDSG